MTPASAETIALKALAYLVNLPDALDRFMAGSGVNSQELRARATEPGLLAGVLDFLLRDEALLTGFCEDTSTNPREVHLAVHVLAGQ